jgi:hypothetical protein
VSLIRFGRRDAVGWVLTNFVFRIHHLFCVGEYIVGHVTLHDDDAVCVGGNNPGSTSKRRKFCIAI